MLHNSVESYRVNKELLGKPFGPQPLGLTFWVSKVLHLCRALAANNKEKFHGIGHHDPQR